MEDKLTFNPRFEKLGRKENAEIRFFCEALSLVDAVNNSNILLGFTTQVQESKDGKIKWTHIPDFFPETTKSATYISSIERMFDLLDQVVRKGWITPMRTKSLCHIALDAHNYHKNDFKVFLEQGKSTPQKHAAAKRKQSVADAWKTMAERLQELAKFQNEHMSYHADFQKENYLPHPDSWKVYMGTFIFIFVALICTIC